ncbi:hypothetical protein FHT12_002904 [Xanthomonas campestris]|nr:hypothetical protein [Xanthomonas euroxanthea]
MVQGLAAALSSSRSVAAQPQWPSRPGAMDCLRQVRNRHRWPSPPG